MVSEANLSINVAEAVELSTQRIVSGLDSPLFVTSPLGDRNRLFVLEQNSGEIKVLDLATETLLPSPFLTIPSGELLNNGFEQGLLGLAFHPNYAGNGKFYVSYTAPGGGDDGQTKVVEYQVDPANPNRADPNTDRLILAIDQPQQNHNGGWLAFGPDGYLYWASGDGGGSGFRPGIPSESDNSQDITDNLLGKILRLDVDGDAFPDDRDRNYAIPDSNPFVNQPGDDEIWAYGLRNPWRPSFDRLTGDLYIADVGQNRQEEINFQPASSSGGENYGWNLYEGNLLYRPGTIPPDLTFPIHEYDHSEGSSITGGYVYRGAADELSGTYFFGDFVTSRIWSFRYDGTTVSEFTERTDELASDDGGSIDNIASFGEDQAGNLYIVDLDGEIFRLTVETKTPATFDVQTYFNVSQFAQFELLDEGISLSLPEAEINGINLSLLFDETLYLAEHNDVATLVQSGTFRSGFEHFVASGLSEGRNPSILLNETFYRAENADVAAAVDNGVFESGLQHYLLFGATEGRDPSSVFDESDYLLENPDVQTAVAEGSFTNGFDHYLEFGATEGRSPSLLLFQEAFYQQSNPDVAQAIADGLFTSSLDHYIQFGQTEGRDPSALFDESAYLAANADIVPHITNGSFSSGFEHFIKIGRTEGRQAIAVSG